MGGIGDEAAAGVWILSDEAAALGGIDDVAAAGFWILSDDAGAAGAAGIWILSDGAAAGVAGTTTGDASDEGWRSGEADGRERDGERELEYTDEDSSLE